MTLPRSSSQLAPWFSWLTLAAAVSLAGGCGTESAADTDSETTSGDGDGDSETGDGDGDTGEPFEPIPARGNIALKDVVVNQGVDVLIATDGVWVGPAERNTIVVANRDTLLRGFWEIPEDWTPRPITAVLELGYPDGTSLTMEDEKMIEGPAFAGDLNRGFVFALVAEQFPPGVTYHMSLWETEAGYEELPESETIIESPIGGPELIGAQSEPLELKIVMFPVIYDNGQGCSTNTAVEVTEEQEQNFINYHHEQYPIQELLWEFRRNEPIVIDFALNSLAQLWAPLQDLRAADNAPANAYYYALVNVCTGGIDGAAGIAPGLATDTKAAAFERVSSGVWLDGQPYAYHTMVHELGHNHGRAHIFCAGGDAAGTDPSYPHDDGIIGVWGFGIRNFKLYSPTATRDIMTYCEPSWVSDWGWSKAFLRIRTLTSWDYEGAPAGGEGAPAGGEGAPAGAEGGEGATAGDEPPAGEVMIGLLMKDGSEQWWTTPGAREPEHFSSGQSIAFAYGDAVIDSPTNVQILDDGTTMVTTMVPRPFTEFDMATRIDAGQPKQIELMRR